MLTIAEFAELHLHNTDNKRWIRALLDKKRRTRDGEVKTGASLAAESCVRNKEALRAMRCIRGGMAGAQRPSLVEWEEKHLNRFVAAIIAACVFGATGMTLPLVALAELAESAEHGAAEIAPAMNLEEVATAPGLPGLTVTNALGGVAHLFPTVRGSVVRSQAVQTSPLLYHSGSPIMPTAAIYSIFWVPPYLQNGASTSLSASYQSLTTQLAGDYPAHGIDNNKSR